MSLSYTDWCDERDLPYENDEQKIAWLRWCEEEANKPRPTPLPCFDLRITRTWQDDRDAERKRRSYGILYRLIFPPPIPVVAFPRLAKNEWLGWHGLD